MTVLSAKERKIADQLKSANIRMLQEAYIRWQRFVTHELALLDEADPAYDDLTQPSRRDRSQGSNLTRAEYRELSAIFERRRQELGYTPDDLGRRQLLNRIANELEAKNEDGSPRPDDMAMVWVGDDLAEIKHKVVKDRMRSTTVTASWYSSRTLQIAGGLLLVCACSGCLVLNVLLGDASAAAPLSSVAVGSRAMMVAPLLGAQLDDLALAATLRPAHPVVLCIDDSEQIAERKEATLVLTRTTSIQTYDVTTDQASADLVLADCQVEPPAPVLAARLRESQVAQVISPAVVQHVSVLGPDSDPSQIAPDQMVVDLTLTNPSIATSVLVLADGSRWPAVSTSGATVRYIVPRSDTAQQAALEQQHDTALPQLVPLTLPVPTSRIAILQHAVRVTDVQVSQAGDRLVVQATITLLSGTESLMLLASDAYLDGPAGSGVVSWTPPTLEAGKRTSIRLELPALPAGQQTVTIAGYQFVISK